MTKPNMAWLTVLAFLGCSNAGNVGDRDQSSAKKDVSNVDAPATITIDGSSTVYPITQSVAAAFNAKHAFKVSAAFSGTGGGFKKFCNGEIMINGASRPITAREVEACRKAGIRYVELPIGLDGIVVAVSASNDWASTITISELKTLWEPAAQGKILRWSQVRSGWPDKPIHLYGAGTDSGTYDYFTAAVIGTEHASRSDFTSSEDDDALVEDVVKDPLALGFFGLAYYTKNRSRLKALAVDDEKATNGVGPVAPNVESVSNGAYQPLSRPMFLYVSTRAADRTECAEFIRYFVSAARSLVTDVGYVALPERGYELVLNRFEHRVAGSLFHGRGSTIGVAAKELIAGE